MIEFEGMVLLVKKERIGLLLSMEGKENNTVKVYACFATL